MLAQAQGQQQQQTSEPNFFEIQKRTYEYLKQHNLSTESEDGESSQKPVEWLNSSAGNGSGSNVLVRTAKFPDDGHL